MLKEVRLMTISGEEKDFRFLATGTTAYRYRQIFQRDLMVEITKMGGLNGEGTPDDSLDSMVISKLAFIMNAQAEGKDVKKLNCDMFLEWADQFPAMELTSHGVEIVEIYLGSKATTSIPKKD